MRTNIVIDDHLMEEAKKVSGLSTKRAVIEDALTTLIRLHSERKIKSLKGKVTWEGNLDEMRS